jgi:hypothetical protein
MTYTLAWKELREHQGVWLTMVCMTVGLGLGLAKVVSFNDSHMALPVAAFTILGMAATYGIVCGSMMFAGEHEGGTLVFLDIFLGRRGLLWMGKFAIGALLVMTQALCVAMILSVLNQQAPHWAMALIGQSVDLLPAGAVPEGAAVWYLILPVVTLEAFAWGMLGSALTQRVLAGAAIAAVGFTPVWLLAITAPGPVFFPFRVMLAVGLLLISALTFLNQSREAALGAPSADPEEPRDPKEQFLAEWDRYEKKAEYTDAPLVETLPVSVPAKATPVPDDDPLGDLRAAMKSRSLDEEPEQAESPREVLWWLTHEQSRALLAILAVCGLTFGFAFLWLNVQVLWPLATLLLGVVCGVAAFAPEQRDLSYQFLAAQHFPLQVIWRFKIVYWLTAAVLLALIMILIMLIPGVLVKRALGDRLFLTGTLVDQMGPTLFYCVWLPYGFCVGQLFVWLCRKSILALLISFLVAAAAIGLWLPSLLCGGMSGWQVLVTPLAMLAATSFLMRAWTGGRIWERRPMKALLGVGASLGVWALLNFGYRAWEIPEVGAPLDAVAFKAALPAARDNAGAKVIHKAIGHFDEAQSLQHIIANWGNQPQAGNLADHQAKLEESEKRWPEAMAETPRLPIGVLETPRSDGQAPQLKHLPTCRRMAKELRKRARTAPRDLAFEQIAQILALSRNLRNKAPLDSYLTGVDVEEEALEGLDHWLDRGKPNPKLLRRVLDELNRHAEETPPPLDCLQTECFRSGGLLENPNAWSFAVRGGGAIPERWLIGNIALSMETPWEDERKTRLWQLVWSGLFRGIQTPHWQLPKPSADPHPEKPATGSVLHGWLPATEGPGAGVSRARMLRLLDASWLADERLFCAVPRLRDAATRARWHVDSTRQAVAVALYRLDEGDVPKELPAIVPKYLPNGLPIDPYSGSPYRYRIAPVNGQAILWSTGPDGIDHGGLNHGGHLRDDDAQWQRGGFDLITFVPQWR